MKCPYCNYEHEEEYNYSKKEYIATIGDESFIELYFGHEVKIKDSEVYWHNHDGDIKVNLLACPKCKIIFLNI